MTPRKDLPRSTTAPEPSGASRTTTLRREVLERGRRLVAARDPRTGAWRLYSVGRDGGLPPEATRPGGPGTGRRETA